MKTNVSLLAYFYRDAAATLQAVRFGSAWRPEIVEGAARLVRAASPLPAGFFSEHITSIAALVGKNSAGKSTIIEDVCRILNGKKTKASAACLVYSCDQGMFQVGDADFPVVVEGEELHVEERNTNKDLHVYYYSSAIDPFARHGALVSSDGALEFTDISSQTVFTTDLLEDDFIDKIHYLRHVLEAQVDTLELCPEHGRPRSIKFTSALPYDVEESAQAVVGMMLRSLPANDRRRRGLILELAHRNVAEPEALEEALSAPQPPKNARLFLPGRGYYEALSAHLRRWQEGAEVFEQPGTFRLVVGAMGDAVRWKDDKEFEDLVAKFSTVLNDLDGCVAQLLGPKVVSFANLLFDVLQTPFSGVSQMADDYTEFEIEITGDRHADGTPFTADAQLEIILRLLLELRRQSIRWSFGFSGISEGQKTLLTFYSRLHVALRRAQGGRNVVILIDEHEHGLHPEWQRRYLKELIGFIEREHKDASTWQILLSTHSPFVVSDLPAQLVNIVEPTSGKRQETFAANLLDLLLSPVFMEKSTGEFAASKIREILAGIANANTPEELRKWRAATRVIADRLTKNFCNQKIEEKEAGFRQDYD